MNNKLINNKQKIIVLSTIFLIEEKKIVIFFNVKLDSDPLFPSPDPQHNTD